MPEMSQQRSPLAIDGKAEIVHVSCWSLALQSREKQMVFKPGRGLMPAGFKVISLDGREI